MAVAELWSRRSGIGKLVLAVAALGVLSGCVVVPAYGPGPGYYRPGYYAPGYYYPYYRDRDDRRW